MAGADDITIRATLIDEISRPAKAAAQSVKDLGSSVQDTSSKGDKAKAGLDKVASGADKAGSSSDKAKSSVKGANTELDKTGPAGAKAAKWARQRCTPVDGECARVWPGSEPGECFGWNRVVLRHVFS